MQRSTLGSVHFGVAALEALGAVAAVGSFLVAVGVCSGIFGASSSDNGDGWALGLAIGAAIGALGGSVFVLLAAALAVLAAVRTAAGVTLRRDGPPAVPVAAGVLGVMVPALAGVALLVVYPLFALGLCPVLAGWLVVSAVLLGLVIRRSARSP